MTKHLTPAERDAIVGMYRDGEKIDAIAAIFRIAPCTVTRVIKRENIPIRWYRNGGRIAAMRAAE